jgi:chitin synthase
VRSTVISLLKHAHSHELQENELWDKESNHSIGSWVPPTRQRNEGYAESRTASLYGRETYYEPQRSFSPAPSQPGVPPGYFSGRNTPLSPFNPAHQESALLQPTPSRPVTNYLDFPIPTSPSHEEHGSGLSDAELGLAVQNLLRGADLNSVTKREVRRQLEEHFGMDLTARKATINTAIDRTLLQFGQN